MRNFFQSSKILDSQDILSYHFKEQCKLLRKIYTTIPNSRSLLDQPSVRVKANGAIVLNQSYHTCMSLDWTPTIISKNYHYQENGEEEDTIDQEVLDAHDDSEHYANKSFLSAAPLRRPKSH